MRSVQPVPYGRAPPTPLAHIHLSRAPRPNQRTNAREPTPRFFPPPGLSPVRLLHLHHPRACFCLPNQLACPSRQASALRRKKSPPLRALARPQIHPTQLPAYYSVPPAVSAHVVVDLYHDARLRYFPREQPVPFWSFLLPLFLSFRRLVARLPPPGPKTTCSPPPKALSIFPSSHPRTPGVSQKLTVRPRARALCAAAPSRRV